MNATAAHDQLETLQARFRTRLDTLLATLGRERERLQHPPGERWLHENERFLGTLLGPLWSLSLQAVPGDKAGAVDVARLALVELVANEQKAKEIQKAKELLKEAEHRVLQTHGLPEQVLRNPLLARAGEAGPGFDRAFAGLDVECDAIASEAAKAMLATVSLAVTDEKLRAAVLAPERGLLERWPWPFSGRGGFALHYLLARAFAAGVELPASESELPAGTWPGDCSRNEVVQWAGPALASDEVARASPWRVADQGPPVREIPVGLAVVYSAVRAVTEELRRPSLAVDAGLAHHKLLGHWRDAPKGRDASYALEGGRIELLAPHERVQLTLFEDGNLGEGMVHAIRKWRSWSGLKNWAALLRLFSVEGRRAGWVRWTVEDHIRACGAERAVKSNPAKRDQLAAEVELLSKLQLTVYQKDGAVLWERRPVILVGSSFGRLEGSKHVLDGMELQINPLLYSGVRAKDGSLGTNWHPAPVELAGIDHARFPYALAGGLVLPIRWRMAWSEGRDHAALSGENLLRLFGIDLDPHKPGEAWRKLEKNVAELKRIQHVGRLEWDGDPHTLAGTVRVYPAAWLADRTHRELHPVETAPGPAVLTGAELRDWRKRRGLSQLAAAKVLGVGSRTLERAEAKPEEPLGRKLREALPRA